MFPPSRQIVAADENRQTVLSDVPQSYTHYGSTGQADWTLDYTADTLTQYAADETGRTVEVRTRQVTFTDPDNKTADSFTTVALLTGSRALYDAEGRGVVSVGPYSEHHVRAIIKEFNACGLKALEPKPRSGRPTEFTEDDKAFIAETAKCPPDLLDCPFKRWSLEKLRAYLIKEKVIASISLETLRSILHEKKVRLRRIKTWKECNDPKLQRRESY